MSNLIDELEWRGLVQDIMPGTKEKLSTQKVRGYIGFDPTSDSLHVGSLIPILLLMHMQRFGHTPIALVGGATGMVGDPSGKTAERTLLSEEKLQFNLQGIQKQLEKFLDFSPSIANPAKIVNNYDWFRSYNFLHFIRDIGKHISVNYMMSKESVKKRLESEQGISFTEFSYQIIQGYDFLWLYQNEQCELQMGGSDQWGNITTGGELIRKKLGKECIAFTCPLIKKADGSKFGKSTEGNVWLDEKKTSPYHFYQFWLNTSDEDAMDWIKKFTFLPASDIEAQIASFQSATHTRSLQHLLAEHITTLVHGKDALVQAQKTSEALFKHSDMSFLSSLELSVFVDIFRDVPQHTIPTSTLDDKTTIIDILASTGICTSKGEARNAIKNGSISINKEKVQDMNFYLEAKHLLFGKYIVINLGKKNFHLLRI